MSVYRQYERRSLLWRGAAVLATAALAPGVGRAAPAALATPQPLDVLYYRAQQVQSTLQNVFGTRVELEFEFPSHDHNYLLYNYGIVGQPVNGVFQEMMTVSGVGMFGTSTTEAAEPQFSGTPMSMAAIASSANPSPMNFALYVLSLIEYARNEGELLGQLNSIYQAHGHRCQRNASRAVEVNEKGFGNIALATFPNGTDTSAQTSEPTTSPIDGRPFIVSISYAVGDFVDGNLVGMKSSASGVMDHVEAMANALHAAAQQLSASFAQHRHHIVTDSYSQITAVLPDVAPNPRLFINAKDQTITTSGPNIHSRVPAPAPRVTR